MPRFEGNSVACHKNSSSNYQQR